MACCFQLHSFNLKPISKLTAFRIALKNYKNTYAPEKNYFSIFPNLVNDFVAAGTLEVKKRMRTSVTNDTTKRDQYKDWCDLYDTLTSAHLQIIAKLSNNLPYQPLFSIIMPVYNAPVYFLRKAIESVQKQVYQNWQLCIADDASTNADIKKVLAEYSAKDKRVKVVFREVNGHISQASNSALELATGEYMVLLDQDDELRPHSLYMVAKVLNEHPGLALIYSDEDKIDEQGNRYDPYFKTDWNRDLFYGQNMINHLGVYKLSLVKRVNGFRTGFEGSQDYDLALRCLEHIYQSQIYHIPHVLYHWRAVSGSTAAITGNKQYAYEAGLKALNEHLQRTAQAATAVENINYSYRVKWQVPKPEPKVSIVIPTKDKVEVLRTCVTSILKKTHYKNYEVLVIDNKSIEPATFDYYKTIQAFSKQVHVHSYNFEFNFSAITNYGVRQAAGEIVLLLNNDTEVINEDWMEEMVSHCVRKEVGAVGAKLFYPNGQIQHAGVFLSGGHPGIHIYLKKQKEDPGYFNKLNLVQNYSAVTAACLAVRKELYFEVGGLDEKNLRVAYNDVDFCLKLREAGYKNVWTPFAQLIHYESLSRGSDMTEINLPRFKQEQAFMRAKWEDTLVHDPFFNPNLSYDTGVTQYAFPPALRYAWDEEGVPVKII